MPYNKKIMAKIHKGDSLIIDIQFPTDYLLEPTLENLYIYIQNDADGIMKKMCIYAEDGFDDIGVIKLDDSSVRCHIQPEESENFGYGWHTIRVMSKKTYALIPSGARQSDTIEKAFEVVEFGVSTERIELTVNFT